MGERIKKYCQKQIADIKTSPICIIKKWWFWILIIAIVYGSINELTETNENTSVNSNAITQESTNNVKEETKEERLAREEMDVQKQKEKEQKEKEQNIEDTKWSLYATTEQVIKNRLKSPSTAKFLNQKAVYDEANQIYKVQGDVDAQNSFGATIRSTFYAEYNNQLEVIYMTFDNEILVNNR